MAERDDKIKHLWEGVRGKVSDLLPEKDSHPSAVLDTLALYTTQVFTNPVLDYAFLRKDFTILDQLAKLYMRPFHYLKECEDYWFRKKKGFMKLRLPLPSRMWLKKQGSGVSAFDREYTLHSSQFLYLITHAVHLFVFLPESDWTPAMKELLEKYPSVAAEHYERWIFASCNSTSVEDSLGVFQVMGWGGIDGRFNHQEFLEKKREKTLDDSKSIPHCNAVWDQDLWIIAGASEMLAANLKKPGLYPTDPDTEAKFPGYFSTACRLLENRMIRTSPVDFEGNRVDGYNFDQGAWRKYTDMAYAGQTGPVLPGGEPTKPVPGTITYDIGHSKRYVHVFETLYRNRSVTGQSFPTVEILTRLVNQMAYTVFNKDFKKPLFSNYFDGTNGWYRVNYDGREGFGYGPSSMGPDWLLGGYPVWKKFQPDIKKVGKAVSDMIESTGDVDINNFKSRYYEHSFFQDGEPKEIDCFNMDSSQYMLNFFAAYESPEIIPNTPELSINHVSLDFGAAVGGDGTGSQVISVSNVSEGSLNWTADSDSHWLNCNPDSGTDTGVVNVSVDPLNLAAGAYRGRIMIGAPGAYNAPQVVTVTLRVYSPGEDIKPIGSLEAVFFA